MTDSPVEKSAAAENVQEAARRASANPHVRRWGRAGWLGKGVFYLVIGALAVGVGLGIDVEEANQSGALEWVAQQPAGRLALVALAAALALYVFWRLLTAILPGNRDLRAMVERTAYLLSAALYSTIVFTALEMAWSGQERAPRSTINSYLRDLLLTVPGRAIVSAIGIVAIGTGAYFVRTGWKKDFRDDFAESAWSDRYRAWVYRFGTLGWIGRAGVAVLFGLFLVSAALTTGAGSPTDLDRILAEVAEQTWGAVLVVAAGAGLMMYGVFVSLSWRRRRLRGP